MTQYLFVCDACEQLVEALYPMDAVEERRAATCPACAGPLRQSFSTIQVRTLPWFTSHTHYDVLPDSVKGMGPASKEFRDYADKSREAKGGRWL